MTPNAAERVGRGRKESADPFLPELVSQETTTSSFVSYPSPALSRPNGGELAEGCPGLPDGFGVEVGRLAGRSARAGGDVVTRQERDEREQTDSHDPRRLRRWELT